MVVLWAGAVTLSAEIGPGEPSRRHSALAGLVLTSEAEILPRVEAARPLRGAAIPADLPARLGATHYDGRYHLTEKPYLVEGAEALRAFGFGVAKFWFDPNGVRGYNYNADWDLAPGASLADLARHPYYAACFEMPFRTIILEVTGAWRLDDRGLARVEAQVHDLARTLLETYRHREVTFVLQNWEGDWMVRGLGARWDTEVPADAADRFDAMCRWLTARQRGVERARAEVPDSRARVLHALEVNKVLDSLQGIPTLTTEVLPRVDLDLVSWSCYDGLGSVARLWHGVEIIRHCTRTRADGTKPAVFIGEVGYPENEGGRTEAAVTEWWDARMGVFLALDIPWIVHWELYCNEPKDKDKSSRHVRSAEELRGFWLIRPDGSPGWAGTYLRNLIACAGRTLPAAPLP